jgi:hypothetical protein
MTEVPEQQQHPRLGAWRKYGKSFIAAVWATASVVIPLWSGDHAFDLNEKLVAITAVGAAILTYVVPAVPGFRSLKTVVNAIMAGTAVVQTVLSNGGDFAQDPNAWLLVVAAVLGALGVKLAPAASVDQPEAVINPPGVKD